MNSPRINAPWILGFSLCGVGLWLSPLDAQVVAQVERGEFAEVTPPPIRRMVLFNSGVAQVVHAGEVEGNARVTMAFTRHDVDDVLKSLVFEDLDGGTVRSVEYKPAPDAEDVAAREFGPPMTLAQLLQAYRGEEVEVVRADGASTGAIVGVENRQRGALQEETVTLLGQGGLYSISLNEIEQIQFLDPAVRKQFELAMSGIARSRSQRGKSLGLLFAGEGERRIRYSYNVDAPIWRMSYRLAVQSDQATLQAWAHVDNVTGVDWEEVELELKSGHPQTFHAELFTPVLAERPSVGLSPFEIPNDRTLVAKWEDADLPQLAAGMDLSQDSLMGMDEFSRLQSGGGAGGLFGGGGGGFGGGFGGGGMADPDSSGASQIEWNIDDAIEAAAEASSSSQMVRFQLTEPVSLPAGRSAMLPVLKEVVEFEFFSQLSANTPGRPARQVVRLTNPASLPLIRGPLTLYRDGQYLGDGGLPRIEAAADGDFQYGTDPAVKIIDQSEARKEVVARVLLEENDQVSEVSLVTLTDRYSIENDSGESRRVLMEVVLIAKEVQPAPARLEGELAEYRLQLAPRQTQVLEVRQSLEESRALKVAEIDPDQLTDWRLAGAEVDSRLVAWVNQIQEAREALHAANGEEQAALQKVASIEQEQTRLIGVVKSLEPQNAVREQFVTKLGATETDLQQARLEAAAARERVAERERSLEVALKTPPGNRP